MSARGAMKIVRIYPSNDGESHLEELTPERFAELVFPRVGDGPINLHHRPAQPFTDYHNTPKYVVAVNMSGEVEFETADGSKRRLVPGDMLVAEDLTGHGHISREWGPDPHMMLVLTLAPPAS
jgi:hypothetical protein